MPLTASFHLSLACGQPLHADVVRFWWWGPSLVATLCLDDCRGPFQGAPYAVVCGLLPCGAASCWQHLAGSRGVDAYGEGPAITTAQQATLCFAPAALASHWQQPAAHSLGRRDRRDQWWWHPVRGILHVGVGSGTHVLFVLV